LNMTMANSTSLWQISPQTGESRHPRVAKTTPKCHWIFNMFWRGMPSIRKLRPSASRYFNGNQYLTKIRFWNLYLFFRIPFTWPLVSALMQWQPPWKLNRKRAEIDGNFSKLYIYSLFLWQFSVGKS
jgi:hypothetical protein